MKKIASEPRTGALPSFEYNVDVPKTVTQIYGVDQEKPYSVLDLVVYGRFDELISQDDALTQIGAEFYRRLQTNMAKFCVACERVVPVFSNFRRYSPPGSSRRRNLLQSSTAGVASGTYSVLLIYNRQLMGSAISLSDVQRAVYSPEYTQLWTGGKSLNEILQFVENLKDRQFIVGDLRPMTSSSTTE